MWIRSQDKKSLVNVSAVEIEVDTNAQVVRGFGDSTSVIDYWELGEYSTEEKAIKVLDMIQELILYTYYGGNEPKKLFQMPQDSEVE